MLARYHWCTTLHRGPRVRIESGNLAHRLVGLFMAMIMPLCCCSTQVLGQTVLDDETVMVRAGSCCGGSAVADSTDCDRSTDNHNRCDCVRGHLDQIQARLLFIVGF